MATIYNTTDGPLAIDRAGRMIGGRERRDVDSTDGSPLAGHISAGRILVLDQAPEASDDEVEAKPAGKTGRKTSTTNEEA